MLKRLEAKVAYAVTAGIAMVLTLTMAIAGSPATTKDRLGEASCVVQKGAKGLDVRCPNASVAQLLSAFKKATGLRSEYPDQLASARVSVMLRRVQLHDALRNAFAAFNIAIWEDQSSPSVTWLKLVGVRTTVVDSTQEARTYETPPTTDPQAVAAAVQVNRQDRPRQTLPMTDPETVVAIAQVTRQDRTNQKSPITVPEGVPRPVVVNTSAASLFPPENKAEMELARATFANSVGQATPLAPPAANRTGAN
jgi:hypothetical protein